MFDDTAETSDTIELIGRFEGAFGHVDLDGESEAHGTTCGCRFCDPDFYSDPAERDAGERDERL